MAVTDREQNQSPPDALSMSEVSTPPGPPLAEKDAETNKLVEPPNEEEQHMTGWKLWIVVLAVSLACTLMMLDTSIIVTAVPEITTAFNSLSDVGWYGSAYMLACASLQPLTGKMYTHFTIKWLYLGFIVIFEIGSLICALATSSNMLIIGRAVAGIGASGLFNGGLTIIAKVAPIHQRPALTGIVMGVSQIGLVAGPLVGGAFTEYTTWRWCFYINLPIGGITIALLAFTQIPSHASSTAQASLMHTITTKLDLPALALFAPSAIMFLLALEYGSETFGWNSSQTIGLFVGSGVTAILFLFWERRVGEDAMIPFSLFRNRIVALSTLLGVTFMCAAVLSSYYLPIYFQSVKGVGPMLSGVYLLPMVLSQLLSAVFGGFLMGKLGYYLPWAVAGTAFNAIGSGLVTTFSPSTSTGEWIGYQIILGIGRGIAMQVPIIAAQASLPPAQISVAMALLVFTQTFGASIFLSVADLIFSSRLRDGLQQHATGVDPDAIIAAGGTGFRGSVPKSSLQGVLTAYSEGVTGVFYLLIALGTVGFLVSWGIGWKDIRKKKRETVEKTEV